MIKIALVFALFFSALVHGMEENTTTLHSAIRLNSLEQVKEQVKALIAQGASVDRQNEQGMQPIHLAAEIGSIPITRYLVRHGARVNASSQANMQPIHIAAQAGHKELVQWLIEHGADKNASLTKTLQICPINLALRAKQQAIIRYLIEIAAHVDLTDDLIKETLTTQFDPLVSSVIYNTLNEQCLYTSIAHLDRNVIEQILNVAATYGRKVLIDELLRARDLFDIDDSMLQRVFLRACLTSQNAIINQILAKANMADARESWKETLSKALLYAVCRLDENTINQILHYDLDAMLTIDLNSAAQHLHRLLGNQNISAEERKIYEKLLKILTRFARARVVVPFIANTDELPSLPLEIQSLINSYFLGM